MKNGTKNARRRLSRLLTLFACAAILSLAAPASAQEKVGYVVEVKGVWSLDGNSSSRLSRAAALPAGGVIRLREPSGVGVNYIVVANANGEIIERRECYAPDNCQAVVLPRRVATSRFRTLVTLIMGPIFATPDRYQAAISRGSGGEMQETVVLLSAGKVDLSSAFAKMSAGKYALRAEPLGDGKQTALDRFEFELSQSGPPPPVEMKGVGKGLYRLSLLDPQDGQPVGGGMDAWVLICEPETYAKASSDFREAIELTASWGSKVSRATVRSFLRAYLDELAGRK